MVIQVRSVPESQECEVMVEPSTEASRPTRMLVQESSSGGRAPAGAGAWAAGSADRARTANPRITKGRYLGVFIARLLRRGYSTAPRRRSTNSAGPGRPRSVDGPARLCYVGVHVRCAPALALARRNAG